MAFRDSNYGGTTWKHFVSTFLLFTQIHVFDSCSYSTFPFFYILATVSQLQKYDAVV